MDIVSDHVSSHCMSFVGRHSEDSVLRFNNDCELRQNVVALGSLICLNRCYLNCWFLWCRSLTRVYFHWILTSFFHNNNNSKGQCIVLKRVSKHPKKHAWISSHPKRRPTNWSATPRMTAKDRRRWIEAWASHSATRAWIRYRRQTRSVFHIMTRS